MHHQVCENRAVEADKKCPQCDQELYVRDGVAVQWRVRLQLDMDDLPNVVTRCQVRGCDTCHWADAGHKHGDAFVPDADLVALLDPLWAAVVEQRENDEQHRRRTHDPGE